MSNDFEQLRLFGEHLMNKKPELTDEEIAVLADAKQANKFWWELVYGAAEVMADRRRKYAGVKHAFYNFADVAKRMGKTMDEIFDFYIAMKQSRRTASAGQDFKDERFFDTFIDELNYRILKLAHEYNHFDLDDILNNE